MNTTAKPSLLERVVRPAESGVEADAPEDFGCFGWLRGLRERAVMLELRKADGNILAIGYGWIEKMSYDPSEGIALCGAGLKVQIQGRNLNAAVRPSVRLFESLTRHRVSWLREADQPTAMEADEASPLIDRITWS